MAGETQKRKSIRTRVLKPKKANCKHASISDRGFLYPNFTCQICGKQFGENRPGNDKILP